MKRKSFLGFTMIELLVVIAIIGVLATIMLAGFNPMLQLRRARDTKRVSEIREIAKAQEQYYGDSINNTSLYTYRDLGTAGAGSTCITGSIPGSMASIPVSSNASFPYVCAMTDNNMGFCVSVLLDATKGNCGGCNCVAASSTCNMVTGATTHYCVVHQQ